MSAFIFGQRVLAGYAEDDEQLWQKGRYVKFCNVLDNHHILLDDGTTVGRPECKTDPDTTGDQFVKGQEVEVWDAAGVPKRGIFGYYDPDVPFGYYAKINGKLEPFRYCRVPQLQAEIIIIGTDGKKYKLVEVE